MKNIVIITSYPLNSEPVVRNRLTPLIHMALKRDFKVTLISGDNELPEFSSSGSLKFDFIARPNVNGMGFLSRARREYSHSILLLQKANEYSGDLIVVTIPSMFLLCNSICLQFKIKLIDVRDLTWEYLSDKKLMHKIAKILFTRLARNAFNNFDFISVTNNTEYQSLQSIYRQRSNKLIMLPNGVSIEQFKLLNENKPRTNRKVNVCYIGNVGLAQNLKILVDAAKALPHIDFTIVGAGNEFKTVSEYAKDRNAENLKLTGRIEWSKIPSYYKNADILFAQLSNNYDGAMPSKLYEYLSTGKYIIYGGGAQASSVLKKFENNIVIEPNNIEELVSAIEGASHNVDLNFVSNSNKEKIYRDYIREHNLVQLFDKLSEVL